MRRDEIHTLLNLYLLLSLLVTKQLVKLTAASGWKCVGYCQFIHKCFEFFFQLYLHLKLVHLICLSSLFSQDDPGHSGNNCWS